MQYWWCRTSVWKLSFVFFSVIPLLALILSSHNSREQENKRYKNVHSGSLRALHVKHVCWDDLVEQNECMQVIL